jgi:hypothetical protein
MNDFLSDDGIFHGGPVQPIPAADLDLGERARGIYGGVIGSDPYWAKAFGVIFPISSVDKVAIGRFGIVFDERLSINGKVLADAYMLSDTVYVSKDGGNNLVFTDPIAGSKTLSQLVAASSGNVISSGVPTNLQLAQWTDATHIQGINISSLTLSQSQITGLIEALSGKAAGVHNLVDTVNHPVSGLTTGHFLKALSPTTYGFAVHGLTKANIGLSNVTNDTQIKKIASSVDNTVARWDGVSGDQLKGSDVYVADGGTINIPLGATFNINGSPHLHANYQVAHANLSALSTLNASTGFVYMTGANTFVKYDFAGGGVATTVSRSDHGHIIGNITGLTDALAGKQPIDASLTSLSALADAGGYLYNDGSGNLSWSALGGGGDVSKVGTPVANQVAIWTGDGTLKGSPKFTFDETTVIVDGIISAPAGVTKHLIVGAGDALGDAGTDAGDLILRAGNGIIADAASDPGAVYVVPGSGVSNESSIYLGENASTFNFVTIEPRGTQADISVVLASKGAGTISIGKVSNTGSAYIYGNVVSLYSTNIYVGAAGTGIISPAPKTVGVGSGIRLLGGTTTAAGAKGGDVLIYGGGGGAGASRGDIFLGTGAAGYLPAKGAETDVVYYNTATGKLSYGAGGGGSSNWTAGDVGFITPVVGGNGITVDGVYIKDDVIYASAGVQRHLTIAAGNASGIPGTDAGNLILKAGNAIVGDGSSLFGAVYLAPGNDGPNLGGSGGFIYLGDDSYNQNRINLRTIGTRADVSLYTTPKGAGGFTVDCSGGGPLSLISGFISFITDTISLGRTSGGSTRIYSWWASSVSLQGGNGSQQFGSNPNGGNVFINPGQHDQVTGTGVDGGIYFSSDEWGSNGLPVKTTEANVVYYDIATGKISYGAAPDVKAFQIISFANPLVCDATTYKNFKCASITGNMVIEITNAVDGDQGTIEIIIDGTGGYTVTFGATFNNIIDGAISTTAGADNFLRWEKIGSNINCFVSSY